MLTCIIRRDEEPTVIQLTQENIVRELKSINGSEMLLEDSWTEGLRKVRTPFVCLLEGDCTLSANYLASNFGLMKKHGQGQHLGEGKGTGGGGYNRLVMIASCLGIRTFDNRIYNYNLRKVETKTGLREWAIRPDREKQGSVPYLAQVGFVPGAIMRYSSVGPVIDNMPWDSVNLVELSSKLSLHFWGTERRIQVNPNTTYVSNKDYLEDPPVFDPQIPDPAARIFMMEGIGV